jgi:hypothetical protein
MFSFDGDCMITLMASYAVSSPGDLRLPEKFAAPVFSPRLMKLLDARVSSVRPSADGTCAFALDNGHTLWIYDDIGPYEAYVLDWGTGSEYV